VPPPFWSDRLRAAVRSDTVGGVARRGGWKKFNAAADHMSMLNWLLALKDFLV
jgi:hypothetical protein